MNFRFRLRIEGRLQLCLIAPSASQNIKMQNLCMYSALWVHTPIATGKRIQRNEEVVKPRVVHSYKTNMGAIDRLDLVVSASKLQIKILKWWKKVFFHILTLTVANAYVLYKENSQDQPPLTHRHFRRKLVHELLHSSGDNVQNL